MIFLDIEIFLNFLKKINIFLLYNLNHYFGLGLIPKPKPKLADTFGRNRYIDYISNGESI